MKLDQTRLLLKLDQTRLLLGSIYQTNEESANPQRCARLKRSALPATDTQLKLMAAVAMIGLSRMPKNG